MPSRVIREGLIDSEHILAAGEAAEVLFLRLMLVADDYGRFDGRLPVICRRCWPIGGMTDEEVEKRLTALVANGLIERYEVDGKPFIQIPNFGQRTRAMKSKFPPPNGSLDENDGQPSGNWRTPDSQPTGSRERSRSRISESDSVTRARQLSTETVDKSASEHSLTGNGAKRPKLPTGWFTSDKGIMQAASSLGISPTKGETYQDLRARVNARLEAKEGP